MEIHRLKPMQEDYDKDLFEKLYLSTENLRNSLARQINPRLYGVSQDIIKSWFDDKFIYVFNKYYGTMDESTLKGYIINSLKTFKFRVLRQAYSKNNMFGDTQSIEDNVKYVNIIPDEDDSEEYSFLMGLALNFLKQKLSTDAYLVLDIDLNPPPYISKKIPSIKTKIPAKLIAEYLDLEVCQDSIQYINLLRKEISISIDQAHQYFKQSHPQKMTY